MAGGEVSRFRSTVTSDRALFLAVQHSHTLPKKGGPLRASVVSSNEPEGPSPLPPTGRPVSPPEGGSSRSSGCPVAGTPAPTRGPDLSPEGFRLPVALCELPRFEQEEK
jgi:hypothetical protein